MTFKSKPIPKSTDKVTRASLSLRTKQNLDKLEDLGFDFDSVALKHKVLQSNSKWNGGLPTGTAYSVFIKGTDPTGKVVTFCRYETKNSQAGQTFLRTPKGVIQVSHMLKNKCEGRSSYGSKKANSYYSALLKGK
jgi:hypothetical protein